MNKTKADKKIYRWSILDVLILGLQLGLTGGVAFLSRSILPFKYWIAVTAGLLLVWGILFGSNWYLHKKYRAFQKKKIGQQYNRKKLVVKIISIIISMLLACGISVAGKGLGTIHSISGEKHQTHLITVVVKTDSPYQELKDLQGAVIGVAVQDKANEYTKQVLDQIQNVEKIDTTIKDTNSYIELAEELLDETADAIILNEAYRGLIEDEYGNFSTDTRIIYEHEMKQELQITVPDKEFSVTDEAFNVFISGIDTYGKVATVSRSDVNMIVTVNPVTKQILMTSIPRDYYVELASFGAMDKLTHAGIYGVEESMSTLEKEFGITLHYYAKVNFSSLVKIVDALGGINVYNDQAFTSHRHKAYYPVGEIYMDGDKALEFVRERYGLANGDYDRVKNQQKVLKAMINKAISPAIITNFNGILDAVSGSIATSMESKDIQALLQMQLDDMATWDIQQISIEGKGTSSTNCYSMPGRKVYVMQPNYKSVEAAVEKINQVMNGK